MQVEFILSTNNPSKLLLALALLPCLQTVELSEYYNFEILAIPIIVVQSQMGRIGRSSSYHVCSTRSMGPKRAAQINLQLPDSKSSSNQDYHLFMYCKNCWSYCSNMHHSALVVFSCECSDTSPCCPNCVGMEHGPCGKFQIGLFGL
jgi:hypothetical protein